MRLHHESGGSGPPLIIVHGLFGSGENWQTLARRFEEHYTVYRVDLRNHGRSPHADIHDYDHMTEDLIEFIEDHGLRSVRLLGHSMGGKVVMHLATHAPEWVVATLVADMAPRGYPPTNRPLIDALLGVDLGVHRRRQEVSRALAPAIPDPRIRAFLLKGLVVGDNGLSWRLNLPVLAACYDRIVEPLAFERRFPGPALFLRGDRSDYIRDGDLEEIRAGFPQALLVTLKEAGHWLHADQPEAFARTVLEFLAAVDTPGA